MNPNDPQVVKNQDPTPPPMLHFSVYQPRLFVGRVLNPPQGAAAGLIRLPTNLNHQLVVMNSTDQEVIKTRFSWTPQLHERFLHAVNHLGGAFKATPKPIMDLMKVEGMTIRHVKSHLQKFRLGRPIGRLWDKPKYHRHSKKPTSAPRLAVKRGSSSSMTSVNKGLEGVKYQRGNEQLNQQAQVVESTEVHQFSIVTDIDVENACKITTTDEGGHAGSLPSFSLSL